MILQKLGKSLTEDNVLSFSQVFNEKKIKIKNKSANPEGFDVHILKYLV